MLDSAKAHSRLHWKPRLALDEALALTADWYARYMAGSRDLRDFSEKQIRQYSAA